MLKKTNQYSRHLRTRIHSTQANKKDAQGRVTQL